MYFTKRSLLFGMFAGVLTIVAIQMPNSSKVAAQAQNSAPLTVTPAPTKTTTSANTYNYVAQSGDSYSQMARKAIQTYGKQHKVAISQAKILYAEAHLSLDAGMPPLAVGQKVDLTDAKVKSWIEQAQKLSATDEAAWQSYVSNVDFNTDAVGEAS